MFRFGFFSVFPLLTDEDPMWEGLRGGSEVVIEFGGQPESVSTHSCEN